MSSINAGQLKAAYGNWAAHGQAHIQQTIQQHLDKRRTWIDKGIQIPTLNEKQIQDRVLQATKIIFAKPIEPAEDDSSDSSSCYDSSDDEDVQRKLTKYSQKYGRKIGRIARKVELKHQRDSNSHNNADYTYEDACPYPDSAFPRRPRPATEKAKSSQATQNSQESDATRAHRSIYSNLPWPSSK
jgi:hypothetical protein